MENTAASQRESVYSSVRGIRYESSFETAFNILQPIQKSKDQYFFKANTNGAAHSVWARLMTIHVSNLLISACLFFRSSGPARWGADWIRSVVSGVCRVARSTMFTFHSCSFYIVRNSVSMSKNSLQCLTYTSKRWTFSFQSCLNFSSLRFYTALPRVICVSLSPDCLLCTAATMSRLKRKEDSLGWDYKLWSI